DGGCAGTCIAYSGDGGACSATQLCDPSVPYTCIGGVCQPPRDIGEPCGPTTPVCKPGQACIGKICEYLPAKLGKKCVFGQGQCDVGSYCFQPAGQATGTCTAQVQLQGVCGEDNDHIQNVFSPQDFECADGYQANQCQGAGWLLDGGFKSGICSTSQTDDSPCPDIDPAIDRTKPFGDGC